MLLGTSYRHITVQPYRKMELCAYSRPRYSFGLMPPFCQPQCGLSSSYCQLSLVSVTGIKSLTDKQIRETLAAGNGNISRAASLLGIHRTSLWRKVRGKNGD